MVQEEGKEEETGAVMEAEAVRRGLNNQPRGAHPLSRLQ